MLSTSMGTVETRHDCGHAGNCHPPHGRLPSDLITQTLQEADTAILQIVGEEAWEKLSYEAIGFLVRHVCDAGGVLLAEGIWDEDGNFDPADAQVVKELEEAGALVGAGRGWAIPCVTEEGYERPIAVGSPRPRRELRSV